LFVFWMLLAPVAAPNDAFVALTAADDAFGACDLAD